MTENNITHLTPKELSLSQIVYAARKHKGLTQKEVSEKTNITQGTLSKIETATTSLSAKNWFALSQILEIPHDSYYLETIDTCEKPNYKIYESNIKLPKKFTKDLCITTRGLLCLIDHLKSKFGEERWNQCLDQLKIDPLCFYIMHLSFSTELLKSLIAHFYADEMLFSRDIDKIAEHFSNDKNHGSFADIYNKKTNAISRLQQFIEKEAYYQKLIQVNLTKIDERSLELQFEIIDRGPFKNPQILLNLHKACIKNLCPELEFVSIGGSEINYQVKLTSPIITHEIEA